jgi:hypothetical protein
LDAAASAFLRRRLHHRRLRAAAVRALKASSAGADGRLRLEFGHAGDSFTHVPSWLAAHASEVADAFAPNESPHVPPLSIVIMIVGSHGDVQPFIPIGRRLAERHRVRVVFNDSDESSTAAMEGPSSRRIAGSDRRGAW